VVVLARERRSTACDADDENVKEALDGAVKECTVDCDADDKVLDPDPRGCFDIFKTKVVDP